MKDFCFVFMLLTIAILTGCSHVGTTNSNGENSNIIIKKVNTPDIFPFRYTDDDIPSLYEYIPYEKYDQQFLIDSMGKEYLLRNNLDGTETITYSGTDTETKLIVHCIPQGVLTLIAGDASLLPNIMDSYFTFHGYYLEHNRAVGLMSSQERENLLTLNNYIPKGCPVSEILKPQLIKMYYGGKGSHIEYYLRYTDGTSIEIYARR